MSDQSLYKKIKWQIFRDLGSSSANISSQTIAHKMRQNNKVGVDAARRLLPWFNGTARIRN
jgi:hypothetical protein